MPPVVTIGRGTTSISLDPLTDPTGLITNIYGARDHLASVVQQGYFAVEAVTTFDFVSYFDSVEAWVALRTLRGNSNMGNSDVLARARRLLEREGGELRVAERISARRLRRL